MMIPANPDLSLRFRQYSRYTEIKQLAYNIATLQHEKKYQSIAVLSFFHGEGKTMLCVALGLAYAEVCRSKVLIVDTTLRSAPGSLALKHCLGSDTGVDYISLSERVPNRASESVSAPLTVRAESELEAAATKLLAADSDFSMILSVAKEGPEQYGLVLLDTVPLNVKNRNNIDPRLVARVANASILVVSQKLLNASGIKEHLRVMEDPAMHLIGLVSNEGFEP